MKKKQVLIFFPIIFIILFSCVRQKENNSDKGGDKVLDSRRSEVSDTGQIAATDTPANYDEQLPNEYEDPERNKWQNPALVIKKLGPLHDKVVADIGAGTGYFTFPLAAVSKKVIAIDIESTFLDYIEDLKQDYPWNVSEVIETRLTVEDDPMLQKNEIDVALMVDVYSYLNNRIAYLKKVRKGLKDNGIMLIVDFKPGNIPVGPEEELKIPGETVAQELKEAGFTVVEKDDASLQYQYIIKAKK